MSRSKHATVHACHEQLRWDFADPQEQSTRIKQLLRELVEKDDIKRLVRAERRNPRSRDGVTAAVESIPVVIKEQGTFIHYPATIDDIRALLKRLPPGTADGIAAIELTVGSHVQREHVEQEEDDPTEVDPFIGRHGTQHLPGVYCGHVLGRYYPSRSLLELFAYVYAPTVAYRAIKETYLKLCALSTLVHELAHLQDHVTRVGRGRWRLGSGDKREIYAESMEFVWSREVVVLYLSEAYGSQVADLEAWIETQAKVSIPFAMLCPDPRVTHKGGKGDKFYDQLPISWCVEQLMCDVESGLDSASVRRNFAARLRQGKHFELALATAESLVLDLPQDPESLTAKAAVLNRLRRYDEAAEILQRVLARAPELEDAWKEQRHVAFAKRDWAGLLAATSHLLEHGADESLVPFIKEDQAYALLQLGDHRRLIPLCDELKTVGSPRSQALGFACEAIALLKDGQLDAALAAANRGLEIGGGTLWWPELLAVRYEVACRSGSPANAVALDEGTLEALEWRGHAAWVRRLQEFSSGP